MRWVIRDLSPSRTYPYFRRSKKLGKLDMGGRQKSVRNGYFMGKQAGSGGFRVSEAQGVVGQMMAAI